MCQHSTVLNLSEPFSHTTVVLYTYPGMLSPTGDAANQESIALLKFDMRLPSRVSAELLNGKIGGGKAVKDFVEKASVRPVLVKMTRQETLLKYSKCLDKDNDGSDHCEIFIILNIFP